jgi:hypothetical protein
MVKTIKYYMERVLETYSTASYYEEVKLARNEFFERAGRVAEGSEKFETQMDSFLDWYLFDRPLSQSEIVPVKLFLIERLETVEPEDKEIYQNLTKSIHSLFQVLKIKDFELYIKDLFDGEKYIVDEDQLNKGFNKGDIFETRLIHFRDKLVFGNSFVFHPVEVRSFILKQIKQIKYLDSKQRLKLMHRLAEMKLKMEQYTHINVQHIYTEKPLF